ncbi:hypothetical protein M407DRAFT_168371 [Tulasnella calospora MUT 4182]|uniref:Uncharacterized protein n=1 Tax=Tulasnella calospora MUT 4182 TaxID=1051891 RepID=A0A0C3M739_9AGAM|nr:hypothetical protein M407DRAFT_168371 [Tulasnella calospora MUT 4182]
MDPGRPDSTFYATDRSSYQRATRQSPHPLTGHVGDRIDRDYDEDLRSGARATVARKFLRRSEDLNSRVDEDVIDYFDQLRSFSGRGDRERYEEDERPSTRHHPHPPPQMFKGKGRR